MSKMTEILEAEQLLQSQLADFCSENIFRKEDNLQASAYQVLKERNLRSFNDIYKLICEDMGRCEESELVFWDPQRPIFRFLNDEQYIFLTWLIIHRLGTEYPFVLETIELYYGKRRPIFYYIISNLYYLIGHNSSKDE